MNINDTFQPSVRQFDLLRQMLLDNVGALSEEKIKELMAQCQWLACEGGNTLFGEGDPGDAAYFLISGRLRAVTHTAQGKVVPLGDIKPGESVGEVAVLAESKRSASVLVVRDSVVVRIEAIQLRHWFAEFPYLSNKVAKLVIKRTDSGNAKHRRDDHVRNIAIVPITPNLTLNAFITRFELAIKHYGNALVLSPDVIDQIAGEPGLAYATSTDTQAHERLNTLLEALESKYDFVIYLANGNGNDDAWGRICLRHADRMLLVADPQANCEPSNFEKTVLRDTAKRLMSNTSLAFNHPESTVMPSGTTAWLRDRPWVTEPIHVRDNSAAHMARLVRILTGNAIGLVLASGGARGVAHIGVFKALREKGIPIDRVGGTSIGAIIGALIACDWDAETVRLKTVASFGANPTPFWDLSFLPVLSIYSGQRFKNLLSKVFPDGLHIEDLWINYFCVSCDISSYSQAVHNRGVVAKAIQASAGLPGVFPPVRIGDGLHVDGAFMNPMPVDLMGGLGVNTIIACDLSTRRKIALDFAETPSVWKFLAGRFFSRQKRYQHLPTVASAVIQSSLIASAAKSRQDRQDVDLLFTPEVQDFNLMAWHDCGSIMDIGYQNGQAVLSTQAAPRIRALFGLTQPE
jgi:NTE family protein